jgi:hypothetical protein
VNTTGGLNGPLGAPKSREYGIGNGVVWQEFAGGYILWNNGVATGYKPDGSLLFPPPNSGSGSGNSGGGNGLPETDGGNELPETGGGAQGKYYFYYPRVDNSGWENVKEARDKDFNSYKPNFLDIVIAVRFEAVHQGIVDSWKLLGWNDAAKMLERYLDEGNGGTNYNIDLDRAISESSGMQQELRQMINDHALEEARKAVNNGYTRGGLLGNSWDTAGSYSLMDNPNWLESLGGFSKRYTASFEYDSNTNVITISSQFYIKDIYDFDPVRFEESYMLHLAGYARAYEVSGESKVYVWKYNLNSGEKLKDGFIEAEGSSSGYNT